MTPPTTPDARVRRWLHFRAPTWRDNWSLIFAAWGGTLWYALPIWWGLGVGMTCLLVAAMIQRGYREP